MHCKFNRFKLKSVKFLFLIRRWKCFFVTFTSEKNFNVENQFQFQCQKSISISISKNNLKFLRLFCRTFCQSDAGRFSKNYAKNKFNIKNEKNTLLNNSVFNNQLCYIK